MRTHSIQIVKEVFTATSDRMRALSVEPTIVQMALMHNDTHKIARAEKACLELEKSEGVTYGVREF